MGLDEVMRVDPCDGTSGLNGSGRRDQSNLCLHRVRHRETAATCQQEESPSQGTNFGQDFDLGLSNPSTLRKFLLSLSSAYSIFVWESEYTEPVSECGPRRSKATQKPARLSSSIPHRDQG